MTVHQGFVIDPFFILSAERLDGLVSVWVRAFGSRDPDAVRSLVLSEMSRGDHYLLAVAEGHVIGFVVWRLEGEVRHGLAELTHIAVLPLLRLPDVSDALVHAMERDAAQWFAQLGGRLRRVFLKTHATNGPAHALYERCGYRHVSTVPDLFHDGVDERIFTKGFLKEGECPTDH